MGLSDIWEEEEERLTRQYAPAEVEEPAILREIMAVECERDRLAAEAEWLNERVRYILALSPEGIANVRAEMETARQAKKLKAEGKSCSERRRIIGYNVTDAEIERREQLEIHLAQRDAIMAYRAYVHAHGIAAARAEREVWGE